jgi:RNA polymerase sigma-70 factor, ECF subfamily
MSSDEDMAASSASSRRPPDDASREWLRCLAGADGDLRGAVEREQALARLHDVLLRAARAELRRRDPVYVDGPERDDLALQAADDALLAITGKLDQFRGESEGAGAAGRRYPGVAAHLIACGPCGEEFAGLLAAVTAITV